MGTFGPDSSWPTPQCTFTFNTMAMFCCSKYPLHKAALRCDIDRIRRILREGKVGVNSKDDKRCTALYYVISKEWHVNGDDAVESLCEYGADVNERLDVMDSTKPTYLLTAMCEYSQRNVQISIMRALLNAGMIELYY